MKNVKQILVAILAVIFILSCDKDDIDSNEALKKSTISAKWIVSGSSDYKSFEFNESGNYIIVKKAITKSTNDQIVLFGTYEIIGNTTVVLSEFGTLTISEIKENSIFFSIQLKNNADKEIVINAIKKEEMEASTKTNLLCRTWEMVTVNGEPAPGTDMELTVLFSTAGTYFVSYANPEDENDGGLAQWKWKDEAKNQLLYSWDGVPTWNEEKYVEIPELTSSTLKIVEDDTIYILKPKSNTKSATIKTKRISSNRTIKKRGIFKK